MRKIGLQTSADFAIESFHQSHIRTLPSNVHQEIKENDRDNQHLILIKLQCFEIKLERLARGLGLFDGGWLWFLDGLGRRSGQGIQCGFFINNFLGFLSMGKQDKEEEGYEGDFYVHGY